MFYKRYPFILIVTIVLLSCTSEADNYSVTIQSAEQVIESDPTKALGLLQTVKSGLLSEQDHKYYTLLQARALNMKGVDVSAYDSIVCIIKNYYLNEGKTVRAAYACFVLAKIYYSQNKNEKALYNYQMADELAKKNNYSLIGFTYSDIPYNIALLYNEDGKYIESINYLNEALIHINPENLKNIQHAFELKANNYQSLGKSDSAIYFYNKAVDVISINDLESKNRIEFNKCLLLYNVKDYTGAEDGCKQIILLNSDSISTGFAYMLLASVYNNRNKIELAKENIYKAKDFLANKEASIQLTLYELLVSIETKAGNNFKAQQYQNLYTTVKNEVELNRKIQQAELRVEQKYRGESLKELNQQELVNREIIQRLKVDNRIKTTIILGLLAALGGSLFVYLKKQKRIKKQNEEIEWLEDVLKENGSFITNDDPSKESFIGGVVSRWIATSNGEIDCAVLYRKICSDYPMFTTDERKICCLLCTQAFTDRQIAEIMKTNHDDYLLLKKSMLDKISASEFDWLQQYAKKLNFV